MRATAHRVRPTSFVHTVDIGRHRLLIDEAPEQSGDDEGPSPQELLAASLASCTAVTVEMYALRKGWEIGTVEVEVEYMPAERSAATRFRVELRLPSECTTEQRDKLRVIASKCPVHRALEGDVVFEDRVKVLAPTTAV